MRGKYYIGAAVVLAAGFLLAAFLLWPKSGRAVEDAREAVEHGLPVDFEALQAENEDIYAWLYIPGVGINEPLLQREGDSVYYLTHDDTGAENAGGALFTEGAYNRKDFSDTATVIYGRNQEGPFGRLQASYSAPEDLRENGEIMIYLPEEAIRYQVFAAVPFRNYHLLHYFNFDNETRFRAFLQAVRSVRAVDANWREEAAAEPGDSLLILSTNRFGNAEHSYLVLAKRL